MNSSKRAPAVASALLTAVSFVTVAAPPQARGQLLDESCTVSILNRVVQVNPNGTFAIPNVPEQPGFFRVRATCARPDGSVVRGQSEYIQLTEVATATIDEIRLGEFDPAPISVEIQAPRTTFTQSGESAQLTATAILPGGLARSATEASGGTLWVSSDPSVASVGANGLVTAHRRGRVVLQARNEGILASVEVDVLIPNDADGDGLPDEFEAASGLDPNDPGDAGQDADGDGLTSRQEFELGTGVDTADSDGDGLLDGEEVELATDPLTADSDGDGLLDGIEVLLGTDATNPDTDGDGLADGLEVDFELDPLAVNPTTAVRGQVIDSEGAAVAGATAVVFGTFAGLSDNAGRFLIPDIPADRGDIAVFVRSIAAGRVSDGQSPPRPPVAGGVTDVGVVELEPVVGRVTGTVRSPAGQPAGNARVTVTSGADFRSTNAGADGLYQVDGMPSGEVTAVAVDPSTGLRGRASGTLAEGQSAVLDIRLTAAGTIAGPVRGRDGISSVGPGASVALSGPASRATATDAAGSYRFGFAPLGVYRVEASDAAGNRGRTSATITRTSEVVTAGVTYLGRGRVRGTVETALGFPVSGAAVTLTSQSVFGGRLSAVTGTVGDFEIDGVFVGNFTATAADPGSGLGGFTSDNVEFEGQDVRVTITLTPAGTLTGTVFEADGSTPVPGSVVTLRPSLREAVADASGIYRFDNLPLGGYTLDVLNPADGDRARGTSALSAPEEVVTTDLVLNGLGAVDVTVLDAGGVPVPDAQVILTSRTIFDGSRQGLTDAQGRTSFADVLAGPFAVSAMDALELLGGSIESNVLVGETLDVTVSLEAAGAISGTVLTADGATPLPNIRVRLDPVRRDVTTAADGSFRFDMLPVARSPFTLQAFDANGALRAAAPGLTLVSHGDEVARDLILSGAGTVTGVVLDPAGSPASGVGITLDSNVSGLRDLFATTDSFGVYTLSGVPEGTFTIFAARSQDRLAGAAFGEVSSDGQVVNVDVQLEENVLPPTSGTLARFFDANNFEFAVQQDGSVRDGTTTVFRGDGGFNRGAFLLTAEGDAGAEPFAGNGGTFEVGGRQIGVPGAQPTASGLEVRRKVYVPQDGYFARYLEVVSNPTAAALSVDLRLDSHFRFIQMTRDGFRFDEPPRVVATSSGDTELFVGGPDRWVIVDDNVDADPLRTTNLPTVAHVFDGEGAPASAASAALDVDLVNRFGRLQTVWRDLEVAPGETVIVMHFAVQETRRSAALAAAERLAQLPPEALAGLSESERTRIVNFDVPADGVSVLEPLPPLDGTVSGTVLEGDGTAVVADATVRFRSDNPIFERVFSVRTDAEGAYVLASRFNNTGSNLAVPREGFTVEATHPRTGVVSSPSPGSFPSGSLTAERNVIFADSGLVSGTVRRPDGTVASAGTVRLTGDALLGSFTTAIAIDGTYLFTGLPPGTYTLVATTPTEVTGSTSATVSPGDETVADITLVPTGTIAGTVLTGGGAPAVGVRVELTGPGVSRAVTTDTAGAYVFPDLPLEVYTVRAIEPATGLPSSGQAEVFEDQVSPLDLELIAVGSVTVEATFSDGAVATQAAVQIRRGALGDFFSGAGSTDFQGRRTITAVPAGAFTVRAFNPSNSLARGEASGEIAFHGEEVTVAVVVPVDEPPTVSLTAPAAGAELLEGTAVTFEATAADDFGVSRVAFLVDGEEVAADASAPYSAVAVLAAPAAGEERTLAAAAVDNGGHRAESAPVVVRVIQDLEPPTVAVTSPAPGASFIEGTSIFVQATAADNVAVDRVEFAAAGSAFATDAFAPYFAVFQIPADFADAGPTALELRATAVDRAGLAASDAVGVTVVPDEPPTISLIAAPADGAGVIEGETVTFTAAADDDVGVAVDLFVDGELRQTRSLAPFSFLLEAPPVETVVNPITVELVARDTQGQVAAAPPVRLNVIADDPPEVTLTAPAAGVEIVEGSLVTLTADATDDLGVDRVEFFVDGVAAGVDRFPPYTAETRLGSGSDLSSVVVRAVAFDTAEQTGASQVTVVRRDDTVPPSVAIASPSDGSIFSVGPSDVAIVVDTSGSTGSSCGADVDNDGFVDNILKCEILAAKELLNFLDPDDTQVTVIDFSSSAILVRALTSDFALADQALDNILAAGPSGGTNFTAAMQRATNELAGPRARRNATPIQLFFSDGSASFPAAEVTRAFEGGVIANTFAVGSGANPTVLNQMADGTGGVFTPVIDPGDLVEILPRIIQFGIDALAVVTEATDNAGVREVEIRVLSDDGSIDETAVDTAAPFNALFSLPALTEPLDLTVTVTARDFGDNEDTAGPVAVTALPAENDPQIVRLEPDSGVPGEPVTVVGKFFDPDAALNEVSFNGGLASVAGGSKILLQVTVPADAASGPVTVTADGLPSNGVDFIVDSDGDGLSDEDEAALGTDPANPDTDGDGLSDGDEVNVHGTDPLAADTDGDGLADGVELDNGLDPNDGTDAAADFDGDGLTNAEEIALGTDTGNPDTDSDGLSDGDEANVHFTDPLDRDTDDGGRGDGDEVTIFGTDPLDPADDPPAGKRTLGVSPIPSGGTANFPDPGSLFEIDPASGLATLIGTPENAPGGLSDVSVDPLTGRVYALHGGALKGAELLELEPSTGAVLSRVTITSASGIQGGEGLAHDDAGNLYVTVFSRGRILTVDPETGVASSDVSVTSSHLTDLAFDPTTGELWASTRDGVLFAVDPAASTVTRTLTANGASFRALPGIAVDDDGTIFASLNVNASSSRLATIDRTTGAITLIGSGFGTKISGIGIGGSQDADGDGLRDEDEVAAGTDPLDPDTDGDGLLDGFEVDNGFDPLTPGEETQDPDGDGLDNLGEQEAGTDPLDPDTDGDGLSDNDEVVVHGTDPADADTDDDGLNDGDEIDAGTDPLDADSDGDALTDGEEVNVLGTDPLDPDTDGDGLEDGVEVLEGLDPTDPADAGADFDGDGLTNAEEIGLGTDLFSADTDFDGLSDGEEVNVHGTDPLLADTDGGGRSDGAEAVVDGTDPFDPADDVPTIILPATLFDADGFRWDVATDGQIINGTIDAFDGGLRLIVNNAFPGSSTQAAVEDGGREIVIGPFVVGSLRVVRKVFVPADDAFVRYLEVVDNVGASATTAAVRVITNLGSDGGTQLVTTSSGDQVFNADDDYLVTDDVDAAGDPTVVHAFSGPRAPVEPSAASTTAPGNDDIDITFQVEIPAGGRAIVMHFASQNLSQANASASAEALRLLQGSARDGLSDAEQLEIVSFFALPDADGDGLTDDEEAALGTDPENPDTDGDGMLDGYEVAQGFDPLDPADGAQDPDGDGLDNVGEQNAGTDPFDPDVDGDGLSDGDEVNLHGTDPLAADSDDDALSDADEIGVYGTDPLAADSDADGAADGLEALLGGSDPLDPADTAAPIRLTAGSSGTSDQPMPAVDGLGRVHVVWIDDRSGNDEILYSLLSPAGATLIDDTPLTNDPFNTKRPAVAVDSQGQVHVAFQDQRLGGTEVFYTRIDPGLDDQDGSAASDAAIVVVDDLALSDPDGRRSNHPRIAVDGQDRAHVVWSDENDGEVHYAQVGAGGALLVPDTVVFSGGTWRFRTLPSIAVDSGGDAHIVWSEEFGTQGPEIFYAMVDGATGGVLIAPTLLTPDDGFFGRHPDVGVRADDRVVVTVQDQRPQQVGGNNETFMLRLDPALDDQDGSAASLAAVRVLADTPLSTLDGRKSNHPTLALTPGGEVHVTYFDAWNGFDRGDLVYRELDPDGVPLLPEMLLTSGRSASTTTGFTIGFLAVDGRTTYVTWADDRDGALEVLLFRVHPDDDRDGLDNLEEVLLGTDPSDPDSDADGLSDGEEVALHGTDPLDPDTDGGGRSDGEEVSVDGTDPLDPNDDI